MSSLIAKQPKDTRKQTTVSLSGTVLADLELYCRFIDSARDWVVNEALKSVFRRDKAFLAWKENGKLGFATERAAAQPENGVALDAMEKSKARRAPTAELPRPARGSALCFVL